jgi:predicted Zn-dependent protease
VVPPTQRAEAVAAKPLVLEIPRRAAWAAALLAVLAAGGALAWRLRGGEPAIPVPAIPAARPVPARDLAGDLRALLARKGDVAAAELAPFREDPQLRRLIAEHHLAAGRFSRALEDLRGYDRAIMELASARSLQRFAAPSLFRVSIPQPQETRGPERLLMAALGRHLEGKADAARQKLKAAVTNEALPAHVLLVRAHLELSEILEDPQEEGRRLLLDALRRDLDAAPELYLWPLRAIAAQAAGDESAARETANRLLQAAPGSAETFLTSAILFFQAGRFDLAADELEEAVRLDPRGYDGSVLRCWFRWMQVLHDPASERLEPPPDSEAPGLAEMQELLDARLAHDHLPAALLLRAAHHALAARWDDAAEDLRRLERRMPLDRVVAGHDRLQALAGAARSRSLLFDATASLQLHLGETAAALATSEQLDGTDLEGEERRDLLRDNHLRIARLCAGRPPKALIHLEEALKLGAAAPALRDDEELAPLRPVRSFEDLLKRYENR